MSIKNNIARNSAIAIIGMAGRFPDAQNISKFWKNLCNGVNSVRPIPGEELELSESDRQIADNNPNYVKLAAPIEDADKFDAAFFGIFPKKAVAMDPHQRLFLECCWHALEDGGYVPDTYSGSIGVFAGCYMNTYLLASLRDNPDFIYELADVFHGGSFQNEIGFEKDYLATQVSYLLNLRGPSLTIQTACSTSLVAIATACQSLICHESDMALAGAATLRFPQRRGYLYEEGGMLSPDGQCKTFDEKANGTIFGNGVASLLLKRLDDAIADNDNIYAVIRGWGLNNDGNRKPGYTAPSAQGQVEAVAKAHSMAGIGGDTITYIEAHGTGTSLGDPIEIDGLTEVFRRSTDKNQYCAIGSVKTNVGHLDCTAGIAGVIKTALSLKHGVLPPSLNFETANPRIDFENSPFYVNTECRTWHTDQTPRRAGVSSFGVGGTNAHVVLEEANLKEESLEHISLNEAALGVDEKAASDCGQTDSFLKLELPRSTVRKRPTQLLTLSARSENALNQATMNLASHLEKEDSLELADVAYTLNTGRQRFAYTRVISAANRMEALQRLEECLSASSSITHSMSQDEQAVCFMFPGQGSQHINMGRTLYESESVYRDAFDICVEILRPQIGLDLKTVLFVDDTPTDDQIRQITETSIAQPAICAVEYALAQLWRARNVYPHAVIGHSVGEFSAACIAGILSVEDAMTLVAQRGQMMQNLPSGLMIAVRLSEDELRPYLTDEVSMGAVNSPHLCVISGPSDEVLAVQSELESADIVCRPLHTSHAFHSIMMEPILDSFKEIVAKMSLQAPQIPMVSTVTGEWLRDEEAQSPAYWTANLRETVQFARGIENLLDHAGKVLLEVGPGQALTTLARQHPSRNKSQMVLASSPHPKQQLSDAHAFCDATGKLWQVGVPVDLLTLYQGEKRAKVHLPGYPFERKRFWYPIKPAAQKDLSDMTSNTTPATDSNIISANGGRATGQAIRNIKTEVPEMVPGLPHTTADLSSLQPSSSACIDDNPIYESQVALDEVNQRLIQQQLTLMAQQLSTWQQLQNHSKS